MKKLALLGLSGVVALAALAYWANTQMGIDHLDFSDEMLAQLEA